MKEKAMNVLSPYILVGPDDFRDDNGFGSQQHAQMNNQPFVSLLELVSEIYQVSLFSSLFPVLFFSHLVLLLIWDTWRIIVELL